MKYPLHLLAVLALPLFASHQTQAAAIKTVIVIAMENTDATQIYGNKVRAPFINGKVMPIAARADNFNDPLPHKTLSEPHYIWMEAGTNAFADHTFTDDREPVPKKGKNSTASKDHLVTQLGAAGLSWMSYQEDMKAGECPLVTFFPFAARHNPFVFFQDVSGNPPDKNNQLCIAHHKPFEAFAGDLAANKLANYVFITPNVCNDMHGDKKCKDHRIKAGDDWLKAKLPPIIEWANKNDGAIFIIWDEGDETQKLPFFAIGPGVKPNHLSTVAFDHGSLVRSVEEIFGLPVLPTVANNNNFADLFKAGSFP
ncbi:MAG: phosphatidylinositol-3-phosphatase [Bradyrhizobium sp.]|jgi:hypothetical protein|nr:phosphatidylinositol-3-phosphatase [Bradyrhizobium sp.]